ncbi:MAG: hypothetical protein AAGD25_22845 [Cyanobacteria bacterium P01_F01_bin.150]
MITSRSPKALIEKLFPLVPSAYKKGWNPGPLALNKNSIVRCCETSSLPINQAFPPSSQLPPSSGSSPIGVRPGSTGVIQSFSPSSGNPPIGGVIGFVGGMDGRPGSKPGK